MNDVKENKRDRLGNFYIQIRKVGSKHTKLVPRAKGLRMIMGIAKGFDNLVPRKLTTEYEVA